MKISTLNHNSTRNLIPLGLSSSH